MKAIPYTEMEKMLGNKLLWIKHKAKAYEHLTSEEVWFDGLLAEFISKMHEKHPQFIFQPQWVAYADSERPLINRIAVLFGRVTLGEVQVYADTFTLQSDRIIRARSRKGRISTADIKRAGREFTKYFKPETAAEIMKKHADTVRSAVYQAEQAARSKRGVAIDVVDAYLLDHIMANLDTYAATAKSHGATDSILDAAKLAYDGSSVLNSSIGKEFEGYIVHIREGLYMVGDRRNEKVCDVYEAKDLPAHINDKLGQLKLVQDNTHIRNVGMRVDDNTFYVRGERI